MRPRGRREAPAQGRATADDVEQATAPVARRGKYGLHPQRAMRAVQETCRAKPAPEGGVHRQPKRQERGKRGVSIDPPGYDAGKKIKGKKRPILIDKQGLLLHAIIHAADIQDRDGGVLLMSTLFGLYPFLLKLYADSGYQGPKFQEGLTAVCGQVNVEIVKRSGMSRPLLK